MTREFYYNDAGAADREPRAVGARARARAPRRARPSSPRTATAATTSARSRSAISTRSAATSSDLDAIRRFAVAAAAHASRTATSRRSACASTTTISKARSTPTAASSAPSRRSSRRAAATSSEGALWLRTTDFGDDKDRVMRKSERRLHVLRPRRRLPRDQVGARLREGRSTCRDPTITARSCACAPACRRSTSASRPAIRTTCCTRW